MSKEISEIKAEINVLKDALARLEQRLSALEALEGQPNQPDQDIDSEILGALKILSSEMSLVPIWCLRQKCRADRQAFDEALWELQSQDKILLFSGECAGATAEQWANSLVSKFGHRRFYVRLES